MTLDVPYYSQFKDIKSKDWRNKGCGVTSLKMVLECYRQGNPSIDELFQKGLDINAYSEELGWYHHGLVNIAQNLGFKGISRSWDLSADYLLKLKEKGFKEEDIQIMSDQLLNEGVFTLKEELKDKHPVIVSISRHFKQGGSGHLPVLIGFDASFFYFNDPDDLDNPGKKIRVSYKDFKKVWTRRAIFIY